MFQLWTSDMATRLNDPVLSTAPGPFRILADSIRQPGMDVVDRVEQWLNGKTTVQWPLRRPIHLVTVNSLSRPGGAGGALGNHIVYIKGHTVMFDVWDDSPNPWSSLIDAARSQWVAATYGPAAVAEPVIPNEVLTAAARSLVNLAGFLLHELIHVVWREEFGMGPFGSGPDWGCDCGEDDCAPFIGRTSAAARAGMIRRYEYDRASGGSYELSPPTGVEPASMHAVTYLAQYLFRGVLRHRVNNQLLNAPC